VAVAEAEVVPVEALARAVLAEQAVAARVLQPIQVQRRQVREARRGAAPILPAWAIRTPIRTPAVPPTRTARMTAEIKIAHPDPAEGQGPIQTAPKKQTSVALCQPFTPPSVEMTEN
jgi:hypothetical protein